MSYKLSSHLEIPNFKSLSDVYSYLHRSSLPYAMEVYQRLVSIEESFKRGEEYPEQKPVDLPSLAHAIVALDSWGFRVIPSLILTFDGFVKLHWRTKNVLLEAIFSGSEVRLSLRSYNGGE